MTHIHDFDRQPFTRTMARDAGLSPDQLEQLVTLGAYRRVLYGAYVHQDVDDSVELRLAAAALVVSPYSVVCDRTAAWIHGADLRRYRELDGVPPLETYVLRGHDPTDRPEVAGGTRDLRLTDWIELDGLKVTTPIRTAMDLGAKLGRRSAMAAMDELMRRHGFTVAQMTALLPRYVRRRGVIQLRQLVPLTDPQHESQRESWVKLEIADRGLPMPRSQFWIEIHGVQTYRLDFAYPFAMIVVEYDGEQFHTSDEDRVADEARRTWLRNHGWIVIVLTKESFLDGAEDRWIAELRGALQDRAPHLLRAA